MDIMTCPQCRRPADRPMFLPRAKQIIFDHIWANPWCTMDDIIAATQGKTTRDSKNLVSVQLSKIRDNLTGTPYKLTTRLGQTNPSGRGAPRQYRIESVHGNV